MNQSKIDTEGGGKSEETGRTERKGWNRKKKGRLGGRNEVGTRGRLR